MLLKASVSYHFQEATPIEIWWKHRYCFITKWAFLIYRSISAPPTSAYVIECNVTSSVIGYSIVVDEIPYTAPSDELRSSAYAEVEDNIITDTSERTSERFPFGLPGTNLLSTERKSVENLYSDMNDKNVYHEISDDLIRAENVYVPYQIPSMKLSIFTGKKNLNKKCFRNIYAPHGAKFRFIFSVEAKSVQSK